MRRAEKSWWQLAARLKIVCSPPRASERSKQEEIAVPARAKGKTRALYLLSQGFYCCDVGEEKVSLVYTPQPAMAGTQTGHDLQAGADAEARKPPACSAAFL